MPRRGIPDQGTAIPRIPASGKPWRFGRLTVREVSVGLLDGLFNQFKKGLKRTQELVLAPMGRLLGLRRLDEVQLEELEDLLLQADLGVKAVGQLMARLRTELKGGTEVDPKAVLRDELLKCLRQRPPGPSPPLAPRWSCWSA
jgi:signal recognition particle GTPase